MIRLAGILNVTPDSFHDGGRYGSAPDAVAQGMALWEAGADWVDVGGESTRPGAAEVSPEEEAHRVLPVVQALAERGVAVSIDTTRPEVARRALAAGAVVVNDVMGLRAPGMLEVIAEAGAGAVIMHMRGTPRTMQDDTRYEDVVTEVSDFLAAQIERARAAGVSQVWADPGIGFGKDLAGNLALLGRLGELEGLGAPLYVGASRKSFIGRLSGGVPTEARLPGSIGAALAAVEGGAEVLRVHDVAETRQALAVYCGARGLPLSPGRSP
ncbi:MAG: dihydropteroate synthase [Alphaproteobacteria bacterium]|nr:dihydropteroate synthase [Alphaproteobacteria bacterium]